MKIRLYPYQKRSRKDGGKGRAQRTRLAIKIIEGPNSGEAGRIRKLSDDARNATKRTNDQGEFFQYRLRKYHQDVNREYPMARVSIVRRCQMAVIAVGMAIRPRQNHRRIPGPGQSGQTAKGEG